MNNESKKILSEISPGELLDKISILEIKLNKVKDSKSLIEINKEYKSLMKVRDSSIKKSKKLENLIDEIKKTNLKLWEVEDEIRICEKNKNFGKTFIDLARAVYLTNDRRAKIKNEINKILDSNIKEIKEYVNY